MKLIFKIFILSIILTSCDYQIKQYGFVLDNQTKRPIKDCKVLLNKEVLDVDSNGFFGINALTGSYSSKNISIERKDYKPFFIEIKNTSGSISYKVKKSVKILKWKKINTLDSVKNYHSVDDYINVYSSNFLLKNDTIWVFLEKN